MAKSSQDDKNKQYKPKVFKGTPYIIKERCKGCGFCIEYCPKKILTNSEDFNEKGYHYPIVVEVGECVNCKICEDICPEFAIFSIPKEEEEDWDAGWWGQSWNVAIAGDKMSIGMGAWPTGKGEGYTLMKQSPSPSWKGKWLFTGRWVTDASGETVEGPEEWTPGDKGGFELNADGTYHAEGLFEAEGNYTFEKGILTLDTGDEEAEVQYFPGYYIYPNEIKSVTMLGDGKELEWELVKGEGLKIKTPKEKPCEHAFTFKIVRGYNK